MTADELVDALERAGVHATVTTNEHRSAGERAEGAFDVLTLHLPNGSIAIGAGAEDAYDVWLEAHPAPSVPRYANAEEGQKLRADLDAYGVAFVDDEGHRLDPEKVKVGDGAGPIRSVTREHLPQGIAE